MALKDGEIRVLMPDGCRDEFLAYWDREASAVPMSRVSHIDHRQIITVAGQRPGCEGTDRQRCLPVDDRRCVSGAAWA